MKAGWRPKKIREITVAKTELMTRGMKERVFSSSRINSTENSTPAIGVLKVAAIPPEAPQATRIFLI